MTLLNLVSAFTIGALLKAAHTTASILVAGSSVQGICRAFHGRSHFGSSPNSQHMNLKYLFLAQRTPVFMGSHFVKNFSFDFGDQFGGHDSL